MYHPEPTQVSSVLQLQLVLGKSLRRTLASQAFLEEIASGQAASQQASLERFVRVITVSSRDWNVVGQTLPISSPKKYLIPVLMLRWLWPGTPKQNAWNMMRIALFHKCWQTCPFPGNKSGRAAIILTLYYLMAFLQPPSPSPSQLTLEENSQLPWPPAASPSKGLAKVHERTQSAKSSTSASSQQLPILVLPTLWKISLNSITPMKVIPSCSECF